MLVRAGAVEGRGQTRLGRDTTQLGTESYRATPCSLVSPSVKWACDSPISMGLLLEVLRPGLGDLYIRVEGCSLLSQCWCMCLCVCVCVLDPGDKWAWT